jgi:hypothetical protein
MTQQDEKKWREFCNQAIAENDPGKLLQACLAVNRIMEEERKRAPIVRHQDLSTARKK